MAKSSNGISLLTGLYRPEFETPEINGSALLQSIWKGGQYTFKEGPAMF